MAITNMYRVTYRFETGGKRVSPEEFQDNVVAASPDYDTIKAVLVANGKINGGHGTLVITSIGHVGGVGGILS